MSSMLEQAIVDAAALRDAALKNAEAAIIEKYAPEIKSAVETLLEQAPMDDDPMDDPLAMDMEPAPDAAEDIVDIDVPLGGLDDEDGRPPSGEQIEIELSFDDLKDMAAELAPPGDEQESHAEVADELDIVSEELEEVTKIVESDDEEDIVLDEQAIAALVEELVVDISPQKGGWAGTPESVMQHNEELALAQAAATEAREENEALRKAVEELSESNTNLKKSNKTLKETVLKMKSTFDEVSTSNAKLIYTNRILSSPSLNERQKEKIVEAINKAGSVDEAKVIYETLQSTGGTSRRRQMPKSLSETIKRSSTTVLPRRQPERTTDTAIDRLQILAGIKHNKKLKGGDTFMSVFNKLTEGIVKRDMRKEGEALLSKWEKTGLLEGLRDDNQKNGMARLLENQAKELLREDASTMAGGDVQGFSAVAFPIVRRVFGGLIANDLVSVQPMSLPSGLIFFLDFTYGDTKLGTDANGAEFVKGQSLYGGNVVGSQITGGVDLASGSSPERGFYALNNSYSQPTGSLAKMLANNGTFVFGTGSATGIAGEEAYGQAAAPGGANGLLQKRINYDPDLSGSGIVTFVMTGSNNLAQLDTANLIGINLTASMGEDIRLVRRATQFNSGSTSTDPSKAGFELTLAFETRVASDAQILALELEARAAAGQLGIGFPIIDNFNAADAVGGVVGATEWALENNTAIPEINIKVDSIAVTANTRKLKAKWTPELGQDLNAYHNLDAEVELTSILSEQIALEIDREIVSDLVNLATAGTLYWSRSPGMFLNRETGLEIGQASAAPDFTGTVSEWYETLLETINDVSARIHRKTLRGGANFIVCSPEVASILEFTAGFRAAVTVGEDRGTAGAVRTGTLSKKLDVYVDPYFPRQVILVGRRGGSFLESGYVYAPYVPLQVTPTIFGVEDFVPRKGVMTRYAKKMVRADMYGLVICRGLVGEAGAVS